MSAVFADPLIRQMNHFTTRIAAVLLTLAGLLVWPVYSQAQSQAAQPTASARADRNLAPGFDRLPRDAVVVLMPVDVELFSLSAGGVLEPKADWTLAAQGHMRKAISEKKTQLGLKGIELDDKAADDFADQVALHAAVAQSIAQHHGIAGAWALPTKAGALDWTFDQAMQPLQARTGARYGLFVWVRDSYASAERKAAMVAFALLGVGISAGIQVGYASLVDLSSGRVVWFNRLLSGTGDLREYAPAKESIESLLKGFPSAR